MKLQTSQSWAHMSSLLFPLDWQQGEPSVGVGRSIDQRPRHRSRPRHKTLHSAGHRRVNLRGNRVSLGVAQVVPVLASCSSIFFSPEAFVCWGVNVILFVLQVGDIVSVIDMPPKEDTGWWRGKHGFQVKAMFKNSFFKTTKSFNPYLH